jgi:hypothetical protein
MLVHCTCAKKWLPTSGSRVRRVKRNTTSSLDYAFVKITSAVSLLEDSASSQSPFLLLQCSLVASDNNKPTKRTAFVAFKLLFEMTRVRQCVRLLTYHSGSIRQVLCHSIISFVSSVEAEQSYLLAAEAVIRRNQGRRSVSNIGGAQSLPSRPVSPPLLSLPSLLPFSSFPLSPLPLPSRPLGVRGHSPRKIFSGTHARTRVLVHFFTQKSAVYFN